MAQLLDMLVGCRLPAFYTPVELAAMVVLAAVAVFAPVAGLAVVGAFAPVIQFTTPAVATGAAAGPSAPAAGAGKRMALRISCAQADEIMTIVHMGTEWHNLAVEDADRTSNGVY